MDNKQIKIVYSSSISDISELNSSFDRGVLKICYVGSNRNGSFIGKKTFESCIDTIYNCPIVCRYDRELDELGSHDMEVVFKDGEAPKVVNLTYPVGVVPESANYWFKTESDENGMEHEYLYVDALLWKRQEAYEKIKRDGVTDESMEITVKSGRMKDGIYEIDDFEFTAFCLLGTAIPCYESASLIMFSKQKFEEEFSQMMTEAKETITKMHPSPEDDIDNQNFSEGGKNKMDKKIELMQQYKLSEDMLDFNIADFSVEELREKFEAMKSDAGKDSEPDKFALIEQFREELRASLSTEKVQTEYGEMSKYWYVDCDNELSEVYAYDEADWNLYGFTYTHNGDHVNVDFSCKKRKKFSIVDYDEGEQQSPIKGVFELISQRIKEKDFEWATKCEEYSTRLSDANEELVALRKFKADADNKVANAARQDVLDKFEDLSGVEAFEEVRSRCTEYDVDTLEEKCFAIRGRNIAVKFSLEAPSSTRIPVQRHEGKPVVYGGVFEKYGYTHE